MIGARRKKKLKRKMKRFKKKRQGSIPVSEYRTKSERGMKIAMLIQLVAFVDELQLDEAQINKCMHTAALYAEHLDNHAVRLKDFSETLYKQTGVDLRVDGNI